MAVLTNSSSPMRNRALYASASLLALLLSGCAISTPFQSGERGALAPEPRTAVVAVTEATLSFDLKARAAFWDGVEELNETLPHQPGLIGYTLRRELLGRRVWTMTAWESEADLQRFAISPRHRSAMERGAKAVVRTRFARVTPQDGAGRLSWAEALASLDRPGAG